MPIYEYETKDPGKGCEKCRTRFEIVQKINEKPLSRCPYCGGPIRKVVSWCRASIVEISEEATRMESKIKEYEGKGMWSHAAELADTYSEKTKDHSLKTRALEDYKKAGYDTRTLR